MTPDDLHSTRCPRRLDPDCTCVCSFLRPRVWHLRINADQADLLWGRERITLFIQVGLLEPVDGGYRVMAHELAEEARMLNGRA